MQTINIRSEKAKEIVRETVKHGFADDPADKKKASFLLGVSAAIIKWQEDSETFGFETGEQYLSISYHLFMGELLIALRNAGVETEEEYLTLSGLDRHFAEYVESNPYM